MAFNRAQSPAAAATVAASSFGNRAPKGAEQTNARPPAQFWLNIGMTYENSNETGNAPVFVSLPLGIPLDDIKPLPTNRGSEWYREFNAARNGLAERILAIAGELAPGEERLVALQVQVRRVAEDAAPLTTTRFGIDSLVL